MLRTVCALLVCCFAAQPSFALEIFPAEVRLDDLRARRQLLVSNPAGDVTHAATYTSGDAGVATVDARGFVTPVAAGKTQITATFDGQAVQVPVEVAPAQADRPVDFRNEIVPLLTRFGCNSGGCHGKAQGQNGFQLSLFGFDPEFDYEALVNHARGRRIFPAAPTNSLLIRKAIGTIPHGGGARVESGSEAHQLLLRWVSQGAPASAADSPRLTSLRVLPEERVLDARHEQQLAVLAEYDDGSVRDVTRSAQFESNADDIAASDALGRVSASGRSGEAAVMVRYQSLVVVFRAIVPHGPPLEKLDGFAINNYIDELAAKKWQKLGIRPSPPASDAQLIRRMTLDLCGRLPTVAETQAFLADPSPDKRTRLADRLLASPDYAAYFAMRWSSILHNSHRAGADRAAYAFHNWIEDMVARNRPYDEFVRGVVAASGEWQDAPAINWYWQMRDDQLHQVVADTAQTFLGLRLQCAQCHHHPYERWSQEDYFGLAGFFTRVGRKSFGQPPPYYSSTKVTTGEKNPLTGQTPEPKYLDGPVAEFSPLEDPRHGLVDWMAQPDNPYFAKALVNRMWSYLLGRGLVDPVDDMRLTNPPSNPELLDALAADFIEHGFDVKHIVRTIATSSLYQLSAEPTAHNAEDRQNFARYYPRRLIAEVFLDAVDQACGTTTRFSGIDSTARAVDLPHPGFNSYFLDAFDRPQRLTGCECERSASATLGQVLLLSNSDDIERKISDSTGRIAKLTDAADMRSVEEKMTEIMLAAVSRPPTANEIAKLKHYLDQVDDDQRTRVWEDFLWTIINTKEFCFNH